jgi:Arsenical resistance operon protein ArsD
MLSMLDETSAQLSSDVDLVAAAAGRPVTDPAAGPAALDVEIFDPPLCCPTGLCGPVLDTTLVDLGEAINSLRADGRTVVRHMMTADPGAFMRNLEVYQLIRERQLAVLPITVVRGRIVKTDAYATLDEMRGALETPSVPASTT